MFNPIRFRLFPVRLYTFFAAVVLAGCSAAAVKMEPLRGDWMLKVPAGTFDLGQTVSFGEAGRVSGHAGCNRYSGMIQTDDAGAVRFGPIAATKRACMDGNRMQAESEFLAVFDRVHSYRYTDGRLQLLDDGDAVVAEFERIEYADR